MASVQGRLDSERLSSVQRALRALEVVASMPDGAQAKGVARRLSCSLATTYRILNTLVAEGYLVHLAEIHGYGLGYKIPPLYEQLQKRLTVDPDVAEILSEVHRRAETPAYYGVFRGLSPVIAFVADSQYARTVDGFEVGSGFQAHASAHGKVMLAALPKSAVDAYIETHGMPAVGPRTITDLGALKVQLQLIRETKIATEVEELQAGMACMSGAVTSPEGEMVGTVSVSLDVEDFLSRRVDLEHIIRDGADACSDVLRRRSASGV